MTLRFGGRRHYVPHSGKPATEGLSSFLTQAELDLFCEQWGGLYIKPGLNRPFLVQFLHQVEKCSLRECAQRVRMTEKGASGASRIALPPAVAASLEREAAGR